MKNIILFILTFSTCISCKTNQLVTLSDNSDLNKIFNKEEIYGLDIIVMFFDSIIVNNIKEKNVNEAYYKYFTNIVTSESLEELRSCIALNNYSGVQALIDDLKEGKVFDEIWEYSYVHKFENDSLFPRLSINLQGKYFQLIELLEKNNDFMKMYSSSIKSSGYINPSLVASVMKHYKYVNFQSSVNRLIWAVHYITILYNDPPRIRGSVMGQEIYYF